MVRHQCPSGAPLHVDMPWDDTCLGSAQGCARTVVSCTHPSASLHSAPASPAGFFLHVGSDPTAQAGDTAQLSSPTFQATNSCSVSHSWDLMSQLMWAWW